MNLPIHPQAIETFLRIDPESAIEQWLKDLEKRQARFVELFTHDERKKLFEQGSIRSSLSPRTLKKRLHLNSLVQKEVLNKAPKHRQ